MTVTEHPHAHGDEDLPPPAIEEVAAGVYAYIQPDPTSSPTARGSSTTAASLSAPIKQW